MFTLEKDEPDQKPELKDFILCEHCRSKADSVKTKSLIYVFTKHEKTCPSYLSGSDDSFYITLDSCEEEINFEVEDENLE